MPSSRDLGVLLVRVGVGATLVAHGAQKLFGWFDGPGLQATADGFDALGFHPGRGNAIAAGAAELGGGVLLAVGLATPVAGATAAGTMVVASAVHGPNGFFAQKGGFEYSAILGLTAVAVGLAGPGRVSLDHLTGDVFNRPWMKVLALGAIAPASMFIIAQRRKALGAAAVPTPAETPSSTDA